MRKKILLTILASFALLVGATIFDIANEKKMPNEDGVSLTQTTQNHMAGVARNFLQLVKSQTSKEDTVRLYGEDRDQINFLFLGVGGEDHPSGKYLTDTIILMTLVPSTKKAAIISIPRDFLVRAPAAGHGAPDQKNFTKINALFVSRIASDPPYHFPGPMGVQHVKTAVQDIAGIPIDYFLVLDLNAVEKIVDTLGGINVRKTGNLEDKKFPDKNYGYETYRIEEGWRYLSGKEAVKYIRTRHTAGGDFDRMRRQQEVALAIKKKAAGLKSFTGLPKLLSLYNTLKTHYASDLSLEEMMRLAKLTEGISNDAIVFETLTGEKDGLLISDTVSLGGQNAYVLKPKAGLENHDEIKAKIKDTIAKLK